ncbi:protein of unknown function [Halopseudomonas sabulinigri]|uniref:Protein NO VEIN C-terminal domain-containing protein n=1 Tax=Halopseudomonas sabulinigri TaxID=472181 RepID=A0A1H1MKP3_9GAMM|nr:DUF3883 domain-containing protein [Halopseudomonas sabulinigri]SDR87227.1 protein of unknown function [Halopseudomonas sabulinigri]
MANGPWSQEEVRLAVADYKRMLVQQLSGQKYSKTHHRRALQSMLNGRSEGSIERKHQNISAILNELECPWIIGYKPLGNYQALLVQAVLETLVNDPIFDQAARHASEQPAIVPMGVNFDYWIEPIPQPTDISEPANTPTFLAMKRDYVAREARNRSLGLAGEELVFSYEQQRLERSGYGSLAGKVEHTSVKRGDGAGYDILSFETDGRERFIEVKTTAFAKATPFYISRNEVEFSKVTSDRYHLYRLFEFRTKPRMFALAGNMQQQLRLDPATYLASLG